MSAVQRVLDALDTRECRPRGPASGPWSACCPAHADRRASLSVSEGREGRALLTCHAGCELAEVLDGLGLDKRDLFERQNGGGRRDPEAVYDYVDETTALLFQVVRFPGKEFRQRCPDGHGGWVWKLGGTRRVLYRLPQVLAAVAASKPIYVVEGEKDVAAVERAGGVGTCNPGGAGKWRQEYAEALRDARVMVVADRDEPGRKHARQVAGPLRGIAASVEVVEPADGKDAADHLAAGRGLDEFVEVNEPAELNAVPVAGARTADRPTVATSDRSLDAVSTDATAALARANDPPGLFVRGAALARVCRDENARPFVERASEAVLRGVLARSADFTAQSRDGEELISPPLDVVRDVLALGDWPFPPLAGIVEAPALRPDGTVLDTAGYDAATRLAYVPAPGLQVPAVPAEPTAGQLAAAVGLLDEALSDFPFVNEAARAGAFALLLSPVVRAAIAGQVPLALLDATKAGTGKGLLASLAATVATGQAAAAMTAPTREEEWEKTIFAQVLRGAPFVMIDEARDLGSTALAAVLTAEVYEGRVLGRSEVVRLPHRTVWCAAGNNVKLRGDLGRRCHWIRLDAQTSRPWTRTGFRHPDLLGWAREHRGDLLCALLTMCRAWWVAGRPVAPTPTLGGFDEWARVVGGILARAGVDGFLGNLGDLYERADEESTEWETFLAALADRFPDGFTSGDVADALDALADVLPATLADKADGKGFRRALGRALGAKDSTRFGDRELRLVRGVEDTRNRTARWRVEEGSAGRGCADVADVVGPRPVQPLACVREERAPRAHTHEANADVDAKSGYAPTSGDAQALARPHKAMAANTSATSAHPQTSAPRPTTTSGAYDGGDDPQTGASVSPSQFDAAPPLGEESS